MGSVRALRKIQLGKESTPGNNVAATDRRIGEVTFREASESVTPEHDFGLLAQFGEGPFIVNTTTEMTVETELSFEQILFALLAGVRGGVSPGAEQTGGQGDFLWTFTPYAAQDPNVDTFTLEYYETDGDASPTEQEYEAGFGFVKSFSIGAESGPVLSTLSEEWIAEGMAVTTITAALGIPTRKLIPGRNWTVKLADTMAGLPGASILAARVLGFSWELTTGLDAKYRLAGSTDLADKRFSKREVAVEITLDLTDTVEAIRLNKFRAGAKQFIRFQVEGSQIGSGLNHRLTFDGAYVVPEGFDLGEEDEGQSVVTIPFNAFYDATAGYDFKIEAVNTISSI